MFLKNKSDIRPDITPPDIGKYILYGWEQSYFTRKLEAALVFYKASFELHALNKDNREEVRFRSATHQIPVLHTSENWMLADTTPTIMMLDSRFPERQMFPSNELGVFVHILEEYFDEWIARTSVHWRWNYKENHELLSMDATNNDPVEAKKLIEWGGKVCRATGVSSEIQKKEAENEYFRILSAAEEQLSHTKYLLGDRPTAVDCIFLGGLRAHFNFDPAPKKVINNKYPRTINWCENYADQWNGGGDLAEFPESTAFGRFILQEMVSTYKPFVLGNKEALKSQNKAFITTIYNEEVSYLARQYVEQSRQMIRHRINLQHNKESILSWLDRVNLLEAFE